MEVYLFLYMFTSENAKNIYYYVAKIIFICIRPKFFIDKANK